MRISGTSSAAVVSSLAVSDLLLARGAEDSAKDSEGSTPLIWACFSGLESVAQTLRDRGADVNAKDTEGDTLLILARVEAQLHCTS